MLHVRITVGNRSCIYPGIRCIFQEDTVAGRVGDIYRVYRGAVTTRNTEESTAAVTRINFGTGYIGAIVIGNAEGGVTAAIVIITSCYGANRSVPALVQQYGASACIITGYAADIETV